MTAFAAGWAAGALALALSCLLPFVVRPLLVRLGIMDVPNERSSHARPILRGLGLAVLVAMAVAGGFAVVAQHAAVGDWRLLLTVVAGSFAAGLLGFTEDLRGLSVGVRSVLLLAIALAAAAAIIVFAGADLPLWGAVALAVYAVLFISSYINVANFMDGLNGISGFHGVIAGLVFAVAGWVVDLPWLFAAGLVLAAGFGGFLPWNLTKPGAFLGDVGSYLLGGGVAITSFAALIAGVPLLAAIGPMVIYFGDVAVTLVKRVRAGHRWDEPHKEHTYQRVQQLGYSHVQASGMTAAATLATSLLGLGTLFTSIAGSIALFAAGFAVLVLYLLLPKLLPRRG